MHAVADKLVLSASSPTVKTAIISPGGVYGVGISPFHRNTLIVPWFVDGARKTGDVFVTNQGANIFTFVHVSDLADLYVLLAGRAIAELETGTDSPQGTWGPKAYYFGAAEESSAAEAAKVRATVLKQLGVVKTDEVKSRTVQEATDLVGPLLTIVGSTNARATSTRAKTLLGWNPKGKLTFEGTKKEYEKYLELEKARKGTA
ncbi:hypothetical protein L228DRAFT_251713 [Xylona heveae TC161]|uniref:NAD(P)-binding protein n=1 Tax=Xylona heveae (strain CBS 132557 / TC161) TaxID=1328760 RepID=A0A164Z9Y8_XYLHT|nr:hypothetical protein L228DRAFT_251713 [Xylona heveae TC161]KZF18857.1 hypothetical protein L228DRAFT_251713 [Xylona heveae TC161]